MNEAGVLGRFIPDFGRVVGHDAVLDVPPLHDRRASAAHRRRAEQDRGRATSRTSTRWSARCCRTISQPHRRSTSRRSCTTSPRAGPTTIRSPERKSRAGSARGSASTPPIATASPGWSSSTWSMSNMAQGRDLSDPRTAEALAAIVQTHGAAQDAAGADRRRHPRRRPRRVERLEGPAPAHPLLGDRGRARRRPFGDRPQGAGRGGAGSVCARRCRAGRTPNSTPTRSAIIRPIGSRSICRTSSPTPSCSTPWRRTCGRWRPKWRAMPIAASPRSPSSRPTTRGCCRSSPAPARRRAATSSTRRSSPRPTASRSTRSSSRAPSSWTRTRCGAASRIARTIEQALRGEIRRQRAGQAGPQRPRRARRAPSASSRRCRSTTRCRAATRCWRSTGLDRPGLLYDLTAALSRLNLNIGSAHIVTFGEKAVDSFYVTDLTGREDHFAVAAGGDQAAFVGDFLKPAARLQRRRLIFAPPALISGATKLGAFPNERRRPRRRRSACRASRPPRPPSPIPSR